MLTVMNLVNSERIAAGVAVVGCVAVAVVAAAVATETARGVWASSCCHW